MFPCPSAGHKSMGHVSGVVDTEADGDDDVGAGHRVDGETQILSYIGDNLNYKPKF